MEVNYLSPFWSGVFIRTDKVGIESYSQPFLMYRGFLKTDIRTQTPILNMMDTPTFLGLVFK